jgi:hypothetical protein
MKPSPTDLKHLKRAVMLAADGRPSLSEFLARLSGLHPDLDAALEGIYTGREGRLSEPIGDWGRNICFNWYSNDVRKHFVEYAYIS